MMLSRTHTVVPQTQQHQQHTYTRQQQQQLYSQPQPIDFDADQSASYTNPPSLSSSPSSTTSHHLYALASQPAIPFDTSSLSIPRRNQQIPTSSAPATASLDSFSAGLSQPPELMPSDSWPLAQYTPQKSLGRVSHHRESSLSSLGSAGPASPYSHNTSNPHIAVDPAGDGFNDGGNQYFDLVKSLGAQDGNMYTGYHNLGGLDQQDMGYHSAIGFQQKPRGDKNLLPADFPPVQNRSHPASVASSSVGGDSPATPTPNESDDSNKRRKLSEPASSPTTPPCSLLTWTDTDSALHEPPKLGRTMTDIYSDELYNPNFSITSATSPHQNQMAVSPPNSDVFAQRLHAANSQHLSAAQSPASSSVSRDRSPFRHDSPMSRNAQPDFNALQSSRFTFNSAHQMREQEKAQQDARMMRQHMVPQKPGQDTPKTISPKEAMLEFHGADDSFAPLFPQQEATFGMDQMAKVTPPHDQLSLFQRPASQQPTDAAFNFMPQLSGNMHIPQHYPFIAHPRQHQDSPMHMSSTSSSGSSAGTPVSLQKPLGANADGGTYTCTYHGCTLRFETPALLQKHKREGHRQPQGLAGGPRRPDPATITAGMLNTQAGPHRCDRINPSTGKSCNTVFSRPYDLTRHEDTIHNARKQKVRCNLCTEEKTFSRADALTRHYRVCHPDVEFPGKYRRRGNHV